MTVAENIDHWLLAFLPCLIVRLPKRGPGSVRVSSEVLWEGTPAVKADVEKDEYGGFSRKLLKRLRR